MKVFVTGGAGYIGSVTVEKLLEAGHDVCVFDSLERGHRGAVDPRARFVQGDLRVQADVLGAMKAESPDAVMHFAAYALVSESMQKPEMYYANNVVGGFHLVQSMLETGVRAIVFSSTCATYGQPEAVPITEGERQSPTNPYGESKLAFERMLHWFSEIHGAKAVYLRYFNACGATTRCGEDHDPETHLIPILLQAALGHRDKVQVFGDDYDTPDGTCIRDYIHIEDLAQAHLLALESSRSGPFNLGTGTGYSVRQVLDAAREVTGCDIPSETSARRPGDPPRLVASADKARRVLGWAPRQDDLHAIIESAWRWHRAHPDGYAD